MTDGAPRSRPPLARPPVWRPPFWRPPLWRRLLRAAATPQALVGALLLLAAVAQLRPPSWRPSPPPTFGGEPAKPDLSEQAVRLVLHDEAGLERNQRVDLALPRGASQRLAAVLGALRAELVRAGVWPEELPPPRVFVETLERRQVAVVDMLVPAPAPVSVAQELAILRSLVATAEANGAAAVRFLRDGRPAATLLGHVAVPTGL